MNSSTSALLALLTLLAACGDGTTDNWVEQNANDRGQLCLFTSQAAAGDPFAMPSSDQVYTADQPLVARFVAHGCLSSSCSQNALVSCSASLVVSSQLAVSTTATWEENQGEGVACTTDCGIMNASCSTPSLPAGTYAIGFGGQTASLTVPSTRAALCMETPL